MSSFRSRQARVFMLSLFSRQYPAIGETHALSVLASRVREQLGDRLESLEICDPVALGDMPDEEIAAKIEAAAPNILCISAAYGTYTRLRELYPSIARVTPENTMTVMGGALPTYLPKRILEEISGEALLVIGEGDETLPRLIERWLDGEPLDSVSNLCWLEDGKVQTSQRALVDLQIAPVPSRDHLAPLIAAGVQIYTEASRGCSWAACSFCLRGLTDIKGVRTEFRRFNTERVIDDLGALVELGASTVTFSDEDFLGGDVEVIEDFVQSLRRAKAAGRRLPTFDVSMTPHSLFPRKAMTEERERREQLLQYLKELGLRKVFLGIESGSESQLKRYAKGHGTVEATAAAKMVKQADIELEIGLILLDSLVSFAEIRETLEFLLDHDLTQEVSNLGGELRLQVGSRYLVRLEREEKRFSRTLYDRELDPDTLAFEYQYAKPEIQVLVDHIGDWNQRLRPIHYPIKTISRYGTSGIFGERVGSIRESLGTVRTRYARVLLNATNSVEESGLVSESIRREFDAMLGDFASSAIVELSSLGTSSEHPIIKQTLEAADYAVRSVAGSVELRMAAGGGL